MSFKKLNLFDIYTASDDKNYSRLLISTFFSVQALLNLISIVRTLMSRKRMEVYEGFFTFHSIDVNHSHFAIQAMLKISLIISLTFYNIFPPAVAATCILRLMGMKKLIKKFKCKLEKSLYDKEIPFNFKHIISNLTSITCFLKELNQDLSLIIFLLIGFWTTNAFYVFSKLIFKPAFEDTSSTFISVFEIINYASQFIGIVFLGSCIENDILETKHLVLTMPREKLQDILFDKSNQLLFLLSALDNAGIQATISAWGMFKIKKKKLSSNGRNYSNL